MIPKNSVDPLIFLLWNHWTDQRFHISGENTAINNLTTATILSWCIILTLMSQWMLFWHHLETLLWIEMYWQNQKNEEMSLFLKHILVRYLEWSWEMPLSSQMWILPGFFSHLWQNWISEMWTSQGTWRLLLGLRETPIQWLTNEWRK